MHPQLRNIANTLAQSAIDAYNARATFSYLAGIVEPTIRLVYDELLIGAKAKTSQFRLAKNIARIAVISYFRMTGTGNTSHLQNLEDSTCFQRATMATHASLKKMINVTNYQRRAMSH